MANETVRAVDALTAYRNVLAWLREFPILEVERMLLEASQLEPIPGQPPRPRQSTLSINAASELVGVSRRTLYLWMDAGKVQFVRTAGGRRRIIADSLWKRHQPSS